jgi:phosphohistidine swiveling domain-containing protein
MVVVVSVVVSPESCLTNLPATVAVECNVVVVVADGANAVAAANSALALLLEAEKGLMIA